MAKAKFIGKSFDKYDKASCYLEYEYRGRRYSVYENNKKGNEPLAWQHKSHQSFIDRQIEIENKGTSGESYEVGIDLFYKIYE